MDKYVVGSKIHLMGYTSTSLNQQVAIEFALGEKPDGSMPDDGKVPVVFEIDFKGQKGLFEMTDGFSAYPNEGEVLLQDGL